MEHTNIPASPTTTYPGTLVPEIFLKSGQTFWSGYIPESKPERMERTNILASPTTTYPGTLVPEIFLKSGQTFWSGYIPESKPERFNPHLGHIPESKPERFNPRLGHTKLKTFVTLPMPTPTQFISNINSVIFNLPYYPTLISANGIQQVWMAPSIIWPSILCRATISDSWHKLFFPICSVK